PDKHKNILQTLVGYVSGGAPLLPAPSMGSDMMGVDPLGLSGAAAAPNYGPNNPNYNNIGIAMTQARQAQIAANVTAHQALANAQQANAYQSAYQHVLGAARQSTPFVTVQPLRVFIEARTKILVDQLPFRVLARISRLEFGTDRIMVCFDNMRELELTDVDKFPSDEHISRILLDAP
ncbi:MAG TPA: hypothetical protein VNO55_33140, partial [Polyangia bacterium]|nr:hypothetical protein [Polyangia bacterium]